MNSLKYSLWAKIMAAFLFVLFVVGFIGGLCGVIYLAENGFYQYSFAGVREVFFEQITRSYAGQVFYEYYPAYINKSYNLRALETAFSPEETNFLFILRDENGQTILSNYSNQEVQFDITYQYTYQDYWYDENTESVVYGEEKNYTMDCYVRKNLTANDRYTEAEYWIGIGYSMRYALIGMTFIFLVAAIGLFVFLMCSAGCRKGSTEIVLNSIDKVPFDVLILVLFTAVCFIILITTHLLYSTDGSAIIELVYIGFALFLAVPLFLLACMSFAARYKLGRWWENTVVYKILKLIYRVLRRIVHGVKYLLGHLPLIWKAILWLTAISFAEFTVIAFSIDRSVDILITFWLLEKLIIIPAVLFIAINLQKLQIAGQKIAGGDLDYRVDTRHLIWDFKRHGENLNNISVGMSKAVEERMRSERFKTELITNVSHDIKTPLTSIINYVDLIKRQQIDDGPVKDYINVLDRQSSRLKKLIEDLVEASKASTGNLTVNNTRTEAGVLLTQTIGEYEERIKENQLELILNKTEEEVFIMADGRLLWRVFDNLLSNICKYSQPGTRVYLNLDKVNERVIITFRNISKYILNISSDELLERFVRGDSARSTEGSGLGLSIAKSLVELQNGKLDLFIDGDLFKVVLEFPVVNQH